MLVHLYVIYFHFDRVIRNSRQPCMFEEIKIPAYDDLLVWLLYMYLCPVACQTELPRVDRARKPVNDDKIKTLVTW